MFKGDTILLESLLCQLHLPFHRLLCFFKVDVKEKGGDSVDDTNSNGTLRSDANIAMEFYMSAFYSVLYSDHLCLEVHSTKCKTKIGILQ